MKNPRSQKYACMGFLPLLWNAAATADTASCGASGGPARNALLELFTSGGCGSCHFQNAGSSPPSSN
jgi:hypothetical protein